MVDEPDGAPLKHAWDWFALHASQRMQTFNFLLVATCPSPKSQPTRVTERPMLA